MAAKVHGRAGARNMTTEERFWSKVDRNGQTQAHMTTPCWVWTAGTNKKGYGKFRRDIATLYAHRFAWRLVNGQIPKAMNVLHRCDCRPCVRPDHLFLGTNQDNVNDRDAKGRNARGARHGIAKLTEKDVSEIRRRHASGATWANMARDFGVTRPAVRLIVKRVTWRHVDCH